MKINNIFSRVLVELGAAMQLKGEKRRKVQTAERAGVLNLRNLNNNKIKQIKL